jgi:hypothetical protein
MRTRPAARRSGHAARGIPAGAVLRKNGHSAGYELRHGTLTFPEWEWEERDAERRRLVCAEDGCLRAAKLGTHKLGTVRTLHDFDSQSSPNG